MLLVSRFLGIDILMWVGDHPPPHFHVKYAEHECIINIDTLRIINGNFPHKKALSLVREWAFEHRDELMENWILCEQHQIPNKIMPLE